MQQEELKPFKVPDYDFDKEKWIDLDGTGNFFLKLTYGTSKPPITEVNFFYI